MTDKNVEKAFRKYKKFDGYMSLFQAYRAGWESAAEFKEQKVSSTNKAMATCNHWYLGSACNVIGGFCTDIPCTIKRHHS